MISNFENKSDNKQLSNQNYYQKGNNNGSYYQKNLNDKGMSNYYQSFPSNSNSNVYYNQFAFNQPEQNKQPNTNEAEELLQIQIMKYLQEKYSNLLALNQRNFGYLAHIKQQESPRFFVIKSFTEEDIHKSIKYGCWSSTREGNKKLGRIYDEVSQNKSDILLFFSMNGSGRFVGVAKMTSKVDLNMVFEYWAMDEIWKGLFQVEWLIIKDIPNKFLKDIKLSNNGYKPVTNSRDTQEIPRSEGEAMYELFENFRAQTSILQHFQYYDQRQELYERSRAEKAFK